MLSFVGDVVGSVVEKRVFGIDEVGHDMRLRVTLEFCEPHRRGTFVNEESEEQPEQVAVRLNAPRYAQSTSAAVFEEIENRGAIQVGIAVEFASDV